MQGESAVCVAEGLQGGNLLPLRRDDPAQDDVQEKRGHPEEDRRDRGRHDALLFDLVLEKSVRGLLVPAVRPEAPPGLEQTVDLVDDGRTRGAGGEAHRDVVERPLHVERRREGRPGHPQHAEAAIVGKRIAAPDREDVLRREANPHDTQHVAPPVEDGRELVSWRQPVGVPEPFTHHYLVAPCRVDEAAPADVHQVEPRLARRRKRDHASDGRSRGPGDVERDVEDQPGLRVGDARHVRQPFRERLGGALETCEEIGETRRLVVSSLRREE